MSSFSGIFHANFCGGTADFSEVYGADSLEVFRIVTAIEEEFEAEFPEETARGIRSVRDAAKALASL